MSGAPGIVFELNAVARAFSMGDQHGFGCRAPHRDNARINGIGRCPCPAGLRDAAGLSRVDIIERQEAQGRA
jgi:hypothetical protein